MSSGTLHLVITGFASFGIAHLCLASSDHVSFIKALKERQISVSAISNGGYDNKGLHLEITNNTRRQLKLDVEPALIFRPDDTSYQDLALLGSETIVIEPSSKKSADVQTFCAKSYAHAPARSIRYTFSKQGSDVLIKVLKYARDSAVSNGLAQCAVWTITNDHSVGSIYDWQNVDKSKNMMRYVAALKHVPVPDYFLKYEISSKAGESICRKKVEKQYVDLRWGHDHRHMYITVTHPDHSVFRVPEGGDTIDSRGHHIVLTFDPARDPKGRYTVEMRDDENTLWGRKEVIVGAD